MLISLRELRKRGINKDIDYLKSLFNDIGHEVDGIETVENDNVVIGHVLTLEKHPDADRLNILQVDIKTEVLQIVCGAPNVSVDQKVIVAKVGAVLPKLVIKEAEIKGQKSHGMICALTEICEHTERLNKQDDEGIFVLEADAPTGENAFEYLELSDTIFDLGLTSNRGDCLSYDGIVREIYAKLAYTENQPLENKIEYFAKSGKYDNPYTLKLNETTTKQFTHRLYKNIEDITLPSTLKVFLYKNKIKSQNPIVDIANYVMLQTGRPIHTYDADKIVGGLQTKILEEEMLFVGLDENIYQLKSGTLVICDDEKIVGIAGVMGSNDTKITEETTNVLIEAAVFDEVLVRRSAKSVNLKTDAASRLEKGVDQLNDEEVYGLLDELLEIDGSELTTICGINYTPKKFDVRISHMNNLLGIEIANEQFEKILVSLNLGLTKKTDDIYTVEIPSYRHDLNVENDISEELIRIFGLDNIKIKAKREKIIGTNLDQAKFERKVEKRFLMAGLNQVVTYSLVPEKEVNLFNVLNEEVVELVNPLSQERKYYRQSILNSLINVAKYNFSRQQNHINIFEFARVYFLKNGKIEEKLMLAGLVGGFKSDEFPNAREKYDFFDLKGILEVVFEYFNVQAEFKPLEREIGELNPYASAEIIIDNRIVGFIGKIHPNYQQKISHDLYGFEINVTDIHHLFQTKANYQQVTEFPVNERDLTITVDMHEKYINVTKVFEHILYLKKIALTDCYENHEIIGDKTAYTFKLQFGDQSRTLTSEEVDVSVDQIFKNVTELGYEIKI